MKKKFIILTSLFLFAFAIILNKLINEQNVQRLGQTFSEIYDDRLLVESYIYQLTELFYKKKIALLTNDQEVLPENTKNDMRKQTSEITATAGKYALTKFTANEQKIFRDLTVNIARLETTEVMMRLGKDHYTAQLEDICLSSLGQLKLLSTIQVREGNSLKESGHKAVYASQVAGQLEWAVYVIVLLVLVSAQRKNGLFKGLFQKYQLN